MGILSRLFGKERPEFKDAERVYAALLAQSRTPDLYGEGKMPDTFEGRIDCLTLHMAPVLRRLNTIDENGKTLAQSVFDAMVDDFDIALRGEGYTDSGVSRRIKPTVAHFYARLKVYTEALESDEPQTKLEKALRGGKLEDAREAYVTGLADYILTLSNSVEACSVGEIARVNFTFPQTAFGQ